MENEIVRTRVTLAIGATQPKWESVRQLLMLLLVVLPTYCLPAQAADEMDE